MRRIRPGPAPYEGQERRDRTYARTSRHLIIRPVRLRLVRLHVPAPVQAERVCRLPRGAPRARCGPVRPHRQVPSRAPARVQQVQPRAVEVRVRDEASPQGLPGQDRRRVRGLSDAVRVRGRHGPARRGVPDYATGVRRSLRSLGVGAERLGACVSYP
jgi:hypothetical protein